MGSKKKGIWYWIGEIGGGICYLVLLIGWGYLVLVAFALEGALWFVGIIVSICGGRWIVLTRASGKGLGRTARWWWARYVVRGKCQ